MGKKTAQGNIGSSSGEPLRLGVWRNLGYRFDGKIDEVRLWDVALTADQVKASYNGGISKVLSKNTGMLGDVLTVSVYVVNAFAPSFTVTDTLPPEFGYFGSFKVDGVSSSPTSVVKDVITYTGSSQLATIQFDVKVTKAYDYAEDVVNTAQLGTLTVQASFTIESFASHFDKSLTDGEVIASVNTPADWQITITVHNPYGYTLTGVVTDNFGAKLDVAWAGGAVLPPGALYQNKPGTQWRLRWEITVEPEATVTLVLTVHTNGISDVGPKELNSGATLKFLDLDGTQLSANTSPMTITVT